MPRYQRLSKRRKIARKRPRPRTLETTGSETRSISHRPFRVSERRKIANAKATSGMCYDPKFGLIYKAPPPILDDLTRVPGIDASSQEKLQTLGLYKLEQLRRLTATQMEAVQSHGIPLETENLWQRWQADVRAPSSEGLASPKDSTSKPDSPIPATVGLPAEPLSKLTGITPQLEAQLADLGIQRFFQIARWDRAMCVEIASRLGIAPGQIQAQRWVEQAQARG